ncbi:MAG: hypothetical protein ACK6D4_18965, partial [Planctomyces sp.]
MRKTLVIAWREYRAMVGTRAFLIGMAVMPLLMLGTLCVPAVLSGLQQPAVRRIAVIDETGVLLQPLQQAAEQRNQQLSEGQPELSQSGHHDMLAVLGMQDRHLYEFEALPADDFDDSDRLLLSERIRSGTLHAFLEIPGSVLRSAGPVAGTDGAAESLMWVSEDAALSDTRRWCEQLVDGLLLQHRLADSLPPALLPAVISQLSAPTGIGPVGLYYRDDNGRIQRGTRQTSLTALALP